jgi:hypothetical protein
MNWIELVQILYYLSKWLPKKNPTVWNYSVQQFFVLNKADILQPLCLTRNLMVMEIPPLVKCFQDLLRPLKASNLLVIWNVKLCRLVDRY